MLFGISISIADALRSGSDDVGDFLIDIPLSELTLEEREYLAERNRTETYDPRGTWKADKVLYKLDSSMKFIPLPAVPAHASGANAQTVRDTIAVAMQAAAAKKQEEAAEKLMYQERKAKALREKEEAVATFLQTDPATLALLDYEKGNLCISTPDTYELSEATKENVRAHAAVAGALRSALRKEAKEKEKLEAAQKLQVLKDWALEHGSELLKARIEGDFSWDALAENEWADAYITMHFGHILKHRTASNGRGSDRNAPTLEEINLLKAVRAAIPKDDGVVGDTGLRWVTYESSYDDDNDEYVDELKRTELYIELTTPTDSEKTLWFVAQP